MSNEYNFEERGRNNSEQALTVGRNIGSVIVGGSVGLATGVIPPSMGSELDNLDILMMGGIFTLATHVLQRGSGRPDDLLNRTI